MKETLIFLINVGVTQPNVKNDLSLLKKGKHIVSRIIEKKIFLRPNDELGIILMGSNITKNDLNIQHVEEFIDIQIPTWQLLRDILNLQSTECCSNWVEALYATLEYIKNNIIDNSIKKVVIISDYNEDLDVIGQFDADEIAQTLSKADVQLLTIGGRSLDDNSKDCLSPSETLLKQVYGKIPGKHIKFDDAELDLRFYKDVPTRIQPSCTCLELVDIQIPIKTYVKVTDATKLRPWKRVKDEIPVETVVQYLDRHREIYGKDDIVEGYLYGNKLTAVGPDDEQAMEYRGGPKSYKICSFTKRDDVGFAYWCSGTTRIVLPSNESAEKPFYSLVQAMHDNNLVAIVRNVASINRLPKIVGLFPCINIPDEPWCLVEIELPFDEDRRLMETRPVKSILKRLTNKQKEVIDNLLDSFTLNDTEDSLSAEQSFLPGCVPNPTVQHIWDVMSHRAIKPDKPLPKMNNYLKQIFEVPSVKEKSKSQLKEIIEIFDLRKNEPKKKKYKTSSTEVTDNKVNHNEVAEKQVSKVVDKPQNEPDTDEFDGLLSLDIPDFDLDELAQHI